MHLAVYKAFMIPSPCINVCIMDAGSGLCRGCARTLDEIARWSAMSDVERERIVRELPARKEAATTRR